jgi:hypothetical protein
MPGSQFRDEGSHAKSYFKPNAPCEKTEGALLILATNFYGVRFYRQSGAGMLYVKEVERARGGSVK